MSFQPTDKGVIATDSMFGMDSDAFVRAATAQATPEACRWKIDSDMADVISMTDKLESELGNMLAEHKEIVAALESLADAAEREEREVC